MRYMNSKSFMIEHATEHNGQVEGIIQAVKRFVIIKPPKEPNEPEKGIPTNLSV